MSKVRGRLTGLRKDKLRRSLRRQEELRKQKHRIRMAQKGVYPWYKGYYVTDGVSEKQWANRVNNKKAKIVRKMAAKKLRKTRGVFRGGRFKRTYDVQWTID